VEVFIMATEVLNVEGMSCQHCVMRIEKAVGALQGALNVSVNLAGKTVTVEYETAVLTLETIKATIEDEGYEVVN
jgi:copper chaperone